MSVARQPRQPRFAGLRPSRTLLVFAGATILMLVAWLLLGLLYSGVGGGTSMLSSRGVLSAVTSSDAARGSLEVRALLATPQYFALENRGDQYFEVAPERNLGVQQDSPGYFDLFDRDAQALAIDPDRNLPVLLTVDIHEGDILEPSVWLSGVFMETAAGLVAPLPGYTVVFRSEHHQTVAIQFPKWDQAGEPLLGDGGELRLAVSGLDGDPAPLTVAWELPLSYPGGATEGGTGQLAGALVSALAVTAGLLVIFSPCAVHMTAYFLPLVTGLGMKEILDHSSDLRFRAHVGSLGIAFVSGFVLLYTALGVVAGFAGQLLGDTTALEPYVAPARILTGFVVIFMALQTLGVFRLPFVIGLQLPGRPHEATPRRGYVAAAISGMSISVGCLTCVGGSLLASLLLYAGAAGSPAIGGLTLFLFSAGMSIPFLLAAFAFERALPRFSGARTLLRYSTSVAAAVMLVVGLLIVSGNDSIFERLVV